MKPAKGCQPLNGQSAKPDRLIDFLLQKNAPFRILVLTGIELPKYVFLAFFGLKSQRFDFSTSRRQSLKKAVMSRG